MNASFDGGGGGVGDGELGFRTTDSVILKRGWGCNFMSYLKGGQEKLVKEKRKKLHYHNVE